MICSGKGLSVSAIARQAGHGPQDGAQVHRAWSGAAGLQPAQAAADADRAVRGYLRERVTACPGLSGRRLLRELKERGYPGGYTAVTDFLRDARPPRAQASRAASRPPPGEQAQVDFAQFQVEFTDEPRRTRIVWLFTMVLGLQPLIWARFCCIRTCRPSCAAISPPSPPWAARRPSCSTTG